MKYIYYIAGIVFLFSGLAVYGLLDTQIKVSEPVLSINDRIFSKTELAELLKTAPSSMPKAEFIESLTETQLLIQEAIRQDIHKEESFRRSVQNFYEQSLIKILLDRQQRSIVADATQDEIHRYESMIHRRLAITKMIYPTLTDLRNQTNETVETFEEDFVNLSDDLKFIMMGLEPGKSSHPVDKGYQGVVIYRLDNALEQTSRDGASFDVKRASMFIRDKKKQQRLEQWIRSIRESADIWRAE